MLEKNGAELPLGFCGTLLTLIRTIRPGKSASAGGKGAPSSASAASDKTVKYPGLAVPDNADYVKKMTEDLVASAVARGPRCEECKTQDGVVKARLTNALFICSVDERGRDDRRDSGRGDDRDGR